MSHNFTIIDCDQRSPEWFAAKVGRLGGSGAKDMLATIKSGEAAARRDLRVRLAAERITGVSQEDDYINAAMQRGIDLEPVARAAYEVASGYLVRQTGFLSHTELLAGCSLDGDVDDFAGIVEIKAPKSATHLGYLRAQCLPPHYLPQVLHNLWVSGARWCDFISYDDRFPEPLQLFVHRVPRDEFQIVIYERTVRAFLSEVDAEYEAVLGLMSAAV
jgi:predicted phage-related endonuclease